METYSLNQFFALKVRSRVNATKELRNIRSHLWNCLISHLMNGIILLEFIFKEKKFVDETFLDILYYLTTLVECEIKTGNSLYTSV